MTHNQTGGKRGNQRTHGTSFSAYARHCGTDFTTPVTLETVCEETKITYSVSSVSSFSDTGVGTSGNSQAEFPPVSASAKDPIREHGIWQGWSRHGSVSTSVGSAAWSESFLLASGTVGPRLGERFFRNTQVEHSDKSVFVQVCHRAYTLTWRPKIVLRGKIEDTS